MSVVTDSDSESGPLSPGNYSNYSNPEEQPLAVAGKSFSELLEDQIHQESNETFSTQCLKVTFLFYSKYVDIPYHFI